MWFTQNSYAIGRIDSGGVVTGFPVPANDFLDIALGPDGNLWLTGAQFDLVPGIGRLTPSGALTEFRVADARSITAGPDGNLWFTQIYSSRVGRITTSGTVTEFVLPTPSPAFDITAGPDGNIWFTKLDGQIGRITSSGAVTEFDVPGGRPYGIAAGPDGNVWFTDKNLPRIGRITPAGKITQFPTSRAAYGIVTGADGNLWAFGHLTLMRITPSGSMTDFFLPVSGDGNGFFLPFPSAIAPAPDGSIWVADYLGSQIVRFSLAPTACLTDPTTLCLNNGRYRVRADWRTRDGSTGQGRGVALTSDSGYFWFFDAANVEVVVKVLNGCGLNSRYWTFAAGLTDVNVILTVTDTQTGVSKTYTNPQGTPFQPIQDTDALAACP
jgi:streptogramin lyase